MHATASELRSISDERRWCSFVTLHPCGILDCSLVVQSRVPRYARNGGVLFAAGPAGLARVVRYQLRGRDCCLPGSRNLCTLVVPDQPADPLASMWIYRRNGFYFSGGGIELPVLWACAQIAQVFLGPGAFRIQLPVWLQLPTLFGIPL